MSLWANYSASAALSVQAHRVTRAWKEGTGGSQCTGSGATWYESEAGQPWTSQGGDIDTAVAAKVDVPAGQSGQFHNFPVTSLVQTWVKGTPTTVLLLRATDDTLRSGANLVYVADYTASPALRPGDRAGATGR